MGVLRTANYNKSPIDKTWWYSFVEPEKFGVDRESVDRYYSKNVYERQKCPSMGKSAPPIPDTIPTDPLKKRKESSLKRAKEKSEASPPPPPSDCFFKEKFEGRIKMSQEQYDRLLSKFNLPSLIEDYAEKLYRWSLQNPSKFKQKKRHDMVIEDWIEKDLKSDKRYFEDKNPWHEKGLNAAQIANWRQNQKFVEELKVDAPVAAKGLNFFFKSHLLKDSKNGGFDISGLVDPASFKRCVLKHLNLREVQDG